VDSWKPGFAGGSLLLRTSSTTANRMFFAPGSSSADYRTPPNFGERRKLAPGRKLAHIYASRDAACLAKQTLRQREKGASVFTALLLSETTQDAAAFHGRSVRARGDGFRMPCSSHADDSAFVFLSGGKL
jgi:hypothetical protein